MAVVFAWAYWPTLGQLVGEWNRQADYSHGYLVPPLALWILWARRSSFPGLSLKWAGLGLLLLAASVGLRVFAARFYFDTIDAWSILVWIAGAVWLLAGWRVLYWSLPGIAFLGFMVPLPFRVERWLSLPLQHVATTLSCWTLQSLGQPSFREGNVIFVREIPLNIVEACSGLRIFVGIVALAFAYLMLTRRAWWEKLLLLASVVPVALVANAARIVASGLLYQCFAGEEARKMIHDAAGLVMIPLAAALFAGVLWYIRKLFPEVEMAVVETVVRSDRGGGQRGLWDNGKQGIEL